MFDNLDLSSSLSSDSGEIEVVDSELQVDRCSFAEPSCEDDKGTPLWFCIDSSFSRKQGFSFFKINRPPSRHKTPPRAVGLELPETPHTPPKTQKDCDEYLHTINLKGISSLLNDVGARTPVDSDYESFSSSWFCAKN